MLPVNFQKYVTLLTSKLTDMADEQPQFANLVNLREKKSCKC